MIKTMLRYIKRIDGEILRTLIKHPMMTLDEAILDEVIYPTILADFNLVGGRQIKLTLEPRHIYKKFKDEIILYIPPEERNNMRIKTVDEITRNRIIPVAEVSIMAYRDPSSSSPFSRLMETNENSEIEFNTEITVIGDGYISIKQDNINESYINKSVMVFYVAFSKSFNNIDPNYYPDFGRIAVMATKMVLFSKLNLLLDRLSMGNQRLSDRYISTIESYATASEEYDAELDTLATFSFLNNVEQMRDLVNQESE